MPLLHSYCRSRRGLTPTAGQTAESLTLAAQRQPTGVCWDYCGGWCSHHCWQLHTGSSWLCCVPLLKSASVSSGTVTRTCTNLPLLNTHFLLGHLAPAGTSPPPRAAS
jgi:hypothetical protein